MVEVQRRVLKLVENGGQIDGPRSGSPGVYAINRDPYRSVPVNELFTGPEVPSPLFARARTAFMKLLNASYKGAHRQQREHEFGSIAVICSSRQSILV
jgi:hypothetical protein